MAEYIRVGTKQKNNYAIVRYTPLRQMVRAYFGFITPESKPENIVVDYLKELKEVSDAATKYEKENGIGGDDCVYPPYPNINDYSVEGDYILDCNKVSIERIESDRIYLESWLKYNRDFQLKQADKIKKLTNKRFKLTIICLAIVMVCAITAIATRYEIKAVDRQGISNGQEIVKVDRWTGKVKKMYTTERY